MRLPRCKRKLNRLIRRMEKNTRSRNYDARRLNVMLRKNTAQAELKAYQGKMPL